MEKLHTKPKEKFRNVTFTIIITRSDPIITLSPNLKFYDHTNEWGQISQLDQLKSVRHSRKKQFDHGQAIICRKLHHKQTWIQPIKTNQKKMLINNKNACNKDGKWRQPSITRILEPIGSVSTCTMRRMEEEGTEIQFQAPASLQWRFWFLRR